MEFVRVSRNVYGQEVLEGASWDLLPWFAGVAIAIALGHALYVAVRPALARSDRA
jgi:hypothetical protein